MFHKNNKKGFTLAELLIVVAIIAVLVAIAIPVFTNQLEKSREATDEANIRSLYAETVAAVLGCDPLPNDILEHGTSLKDAELKCVKGDDGVWTGTGTILMSHQKDGFEGKKSGDYINIGGVSLAVSETTPAKGATVTIIVKSDGSIPTITW